MKMKYSIGKNPNSRNGYKKGEQHIYFGKHLTKEHRDKIGNSLKGKPKSKEHIEVLRKINMGSGNPMFGKPSWNKGKIGIYSEEYKKKLREARKGIIIINKDTSIEVKIQNFLKQLNIEFLTHQYIKEVGHGYQCDILIPSKKIVIECFGDYWHKIPYGNLKDSLKCQELREKGFRVLVFWEREIKVMELNDLRDKIYGTI